MAWPAFDTGRIITRPALGVSVVLPDLFPQRYQSNTVESIPLVPPQVRIPLLSLAYSPHCGWHSAQEKDAKIIMPIKINKDWIIAFFISFSSFWIFGLTTSGGSYLSSGVLLSCHPSPASSMADPTALLIFPTTFNPLPIKESSRPWLTLSMACPLNL